MNEWRASPRYRLPRELALFLLLVHQRIGIRQQFQQRFLLRRQAIHHTDAERQLILRRIPFVELSGGGLHSRQHDFGSLTIGSQDSELVAPQSSDDVDIAESGLQYLGQRSRSSHRRRGDRRCR